MALVGLAVRLVGTSPHDAVLLTWQHAVILALGFTAQQLFARFYKANTIRQEIHRDVICGLIIGVAIGIILWVV